VRRLAAARLLGICVQTQQIFASGAIGSMLGIARGKCDAGEGQGGPSLLREGLPGFSSQGLWDAGGEGMLDMSVKIVEVTDRWVWEGGMR
jgi:hypothetical protein